MTLKYKIPDMYVGYIIQVNAMAPRIYIFLFLVESIYCMSLLVFYATLFRENYIG